MDHKISLPLSTQAIVIKKMAFQFWTQTKLIPTPQIFKLKSTEIDSIKFHRLRWTWSSWVSFHSSVSFKEIRIERRSDRISIATLYFYRRLRILFEFLLLINLIKQNFFSCRCIFRTNGLNNTIFIASRGVSCDFE